MCHYFLFHQVAWTKMQWCSIVTQNRYILNLFRYNLDINIKYNPLQNILNSIFHQCNCNFQQGCNQMGKTPTNLTTTIITFSITILSLGHCNSQRPHKEGYKCCVSSTRGETGVCQSIPRRVMNLYP